MELLSKLDFTALANAMLVLLTAVIIYFATQIGRRTQAIVAQKPAAAEVKMDGVAIISAEPMKALVAAIEAGNMQGVEAIGAARGLEGKVAALTEGVGDLTEQVHELRDELARRR